MRVTFPRSIRATVFAPYFTHGTWIFDDDRLGLVLEPFVSGVPEMIDDLVRDIPNARQGFRLLFSNLYLRRVRERLVLLSEHRAAPASPAVTPRFLGTQAYTAGTVPVKVVLALLGEEL